MLPNSSSRSSRTSRTALISLENRLKKENSLDKSKSNNNTPEQLGRTTRSQTKQAKSDGKVQTEAEILTLKKALKEAINENDIVNSILIKLRTRTMELEALLSAAQDEIDARDNAIIELSESLQRKSEGTPSTKTGKTKVEQKIEEKSE